MTETRATFGADLHLDLAGPRIRASLESALREAVQTGRLHPGTQLPSSRTLAADLGIARNTVADAYGQLVAEGWLTAVRGSGTRVGERTVAPETPAPGATTPDRPARYNLQAGSPDLSAFPRSAWLTAARRAIGSAPNDAFGYGDPRGRPELRRALAGYLSRARGVRASADRIVICSGFTQALTLLGQVLAADGGKTMAIEAYSHQHHRDIATAAGLRPTAVPVDDRGAVVGELGDAAAALLTPAHQFPLGVPLAADRRTEAVEWAAATSSLIIEDDYDGEFRYDRQAVGAMQALAPEHVVYGGTASKTLAPALRLAWLVLPARLVDDVASAKALADRQGGIIDQLTLAQFIDSGGYDRQVRSRRTAYRRRRDRLVAAVHRQAPDLRIAGVAAGLHALLELPDGADEDEVVSRAGARGVAVHGLGSFTAPGTAHRPALVIGYGTPPAHAFTTAIARLCTVLAESRP
jgi:GntR family transcriptional regulator/MocR family aminotransferase